MPATGFMAAIIGLALGGASALAQDKATPNPPPNPNLFGAFLGHWGWEGSKDCADNPHTISFSADHTRATLIYQKPTPGFAGPAATTYTYRVLYAEENKIAMYLEGETRRTDNGDRIVWLLIHLDQDTYAWRGTHWKASDTTKRVVRCKY